MTNSNILSNVIINLTIYSINPHRIAIIVVKMARFLCYEAVVLCDWRESSHLEDIGILTIPSLSTSIQSTLR